MASYAKGMELALAGMAIAFFGVFLGHVWGLPYIAVYPSSNALAGENDS